MVCRLGGRHAHVLSSLFASRNIQPGRLLFSRTSWATSRIPCLSHRCFCEGSVIEKDGVVASSSRRIITFLTDVEGDAAYLNRFVRQSKVLEFRSVQPQFDANHYFPYHQCVDFVNKDSVLVYGGDAWDRGGSDLYVIRQLLDLRRRYGPDRVYFLMGNRDLNKMRILQELGLNDNQELPRHGGMYFLRNTGRQGDPEFYDNQDLPDNNSKLVPSESAVERLKWMLSQTMGSPHAFESRRLELASERRRQEQASENSNDKRDVDVSDQDVVQSYRESCHPTTGEMGRYLSQAGLVLCLGNVLFLHGALPLTSEVLNNVIKEQGESPPNDEAAARFWTKFDFAIPWRDDQSTCNVSTIHDWLNELNRFARKHIDAWKRDVAQKEQQNRHDEDCRDKTTTDSEAWSTLGGYHQSATRQPYGALLQYGMGWTPDGKRNPTVVYSSWLINGSPARFHPDSNDPEHLTFTTLVRSFFKVSGFQLFLCGHQPNGCMPLPLRIDNDGDKDPPCWILCCDTSYAGDVKWINSENSNKERTNPGRGNGTSGRGDTAVSEVLIEQCVSSGDVVGVRCHGVLSDGSKYETVNIMEDIDIVGKFAPTSLSPKSGNNHQDYWVKAKFTDGSYLVSRGEGFDVWNSVMEERN